MTLATMAPTIPNMMFMSTPMLLFMNISASHPAIPPMTIAAIQPTPGFCIVIPFLSNLNWLGGETSHNPTKFRDIKCRAPEQLRYRAVD